MKWREMDAEATVVVDVALVALVIVLGLVLSPWASLGIMVGAFVVRGIALADAPRQVREERHRLRLAMWRAGDRRR